MTAAGSFSAGQTDFDTGVGWWLDMTGATPRFSLGNSGGSKVTWNGTTLAITGSITATTGAIGGWIIGATDLTESGGGGTVGLASSGSVRIWVGSATPSAAPFRVSSTGVATMIGAVIGSATSGARVELNPTNGVSVYDSGGTVRGRLLTTGAGYLGSTDGTSATAALSWTTAGVATINASAITTGTLNASGITVTNLSATSITTGTIVADRISGGSLGGSFTLGTSTISIPAGGKITDADGSEWNSSGIILKSAGSWGDTITWQVGGVNKGSIYADSSNFYMGYTSGAYLGLTSASLELVAGANKTLVIGTNSTLYSTGQVVLYNATAGSGADVIARLGGTAGSEGFRVHNSSGATVFGAASNGQLLTSITDTTGGAGAYYGRIPITFNSATKYLRVYDS